MDKIFSINKWELACLLLKQITTIHYMAKF